MALKPGWSFVQGAPGVTVFTFGHPATILAQQGRGKTATIEKQQYLFPSCQGCTDLGIKRWRHAGLQCQPPNINNVFFRGLGTASSFGQLEPLISPGAGVGH